MTEYDITKWVEEHLEECETCRSFDPEEQPMPDCEELREKYIEIQGDMPDPMAEETEELVGRLYGQIYGDRDFDESFLNIGNSQYIEIFPSLEEGWTVKRHYDIGEEEVCHETLEDALRSLLQEIQEEPA